jgi:C4-dicarboxylate-specific signal transduction histidine kinase
MFNWTQVKRWGVNPDRLPADSVFVNRPLTLWGQYKAAVVSAVLVILILSTMTVALIIQNRQRRIAEMSVRESAAQLAAERDLLEQRVIERTADIKNQRDLLAQKNEELEAALAQIKRLEGIIPICMYCKKN